MLRSTGFFRSIDCPYWAGAAGGPCRRPYCRRHPGTPGTHMGLSVFPSLPGLGYDPYNPELPQPPAERENGALGQGDGMLELELVNQAIEAVRGEVELEQRRYQELLETARGHGAGASALAPCSPAASLDDDDTFSLALTYTPGGLLSPDSGYQPTPLAAPAEPGHKYSLAPSERGQGRVGGGTSALEYVPKAVGQPRRYGRPVSGGKYVVDSSKPSTDLEYDPLSNYSARHLGRASARDERAAKRPRGSRGAEPYTPAIKKPCDPFGGCEARFSDSEDEVASPAKADVSSPKAGAEPESKAPGKPASKEGPEPVAGSLRDTKEMAPRPLTMLGSPRMAKPRGRKVGHQPASATRTRPAKETRRKTRTRDGPGRRRRCLQTRRGHKLAAPGARPRAPKGPRKSHPTPLQWPAQGKGDQAAPPAEGPGPKTLGLAPTPRWPAKAAVIGRHHQGSWWNARPAPWTTVPPRKPLSSRSGP
uniref:RNA exonuclease 1 homolog n=1 Tax=Peromyscus maniculatus bairdii TaxID=230844 RepID=A0A8C8URV1_PERMB